MGRLFGTNGVRGVVNQELTVEKVIRLASAAGSYLGSNIAVGRDGRTSSSMFRNATISGLLSVGCSIHDVGMVPTPTLQFAVRYFRLDGGLMVTASHNPPDFNGIKVIGGDGVEVSRQQETEIEELFYSGGPELCPWDRIGTIGKLEALEPYKKAVLSHVDVGVIREAGLRVAIDPGNGVAALTAPSIVQDLGCVVYTINADVDGRFPGRDSEPRPDNLDGLRALVKVSEADIGVAFDGDGDRSIFIDEKGDVHWGDQSFALVAQDFMIKNPGAEVATPVSSSRVVEDVVKAGGGRVVWTRVGSVVVSRTMVEKGLMLGGEENGGIMYGPHLQVRDGSMATTLILEIMVKTGKPLSELFGELPQYAQMKDKIACPEELKRRALEALRELVDAPRVEVIDGLKLWYPDESWILIRPSGTEPIFRLYAEAGSSKRVTELIEENKAMIESIIASIA